MKYLIVIALMATACAKPDAPPPAPTAIKSEAAIWSSPGAPNWTIDFTGFNTDAPFSIKMSYLTGGTCQAVALATQITNDTGEMTIMYSSPVLLASGEAPCSMFDGSWTYTLFDNKLVICQSGSPCVEMN